MILEPKGYAYIQWEYKDAGHINGVPIYQRGTVTEVVNLPRERHDVMLVVSREVCETLPSRLDLVCIARTGVALNFDL